jgi:ribonuclease-3
MSDDAFDALLERLGVPITDRELYRRALTHPSWALEHGGEDYERLEFLGDAVLAWVVAPRLYEAFPDLPEGDLTLMKIALTSGRTLAAVARELGVGPAIRFGRGAVREASRASVLENAFEALVAAVYLDAGIDAAGAFALRMLGDRIDRDTLLATPLDAKNRLQELTQSGGFGLPSYAIVERTGPVHDPVFTAEVSLGGQVRGRGQGATKQRAEQAAAAAALEALAES